MHQATLLQLAPFSTISRVAISRPITAFAICHTFVTGPVTS